jgi:hypothetical protein
MRKIANVVAISAVLWGAAHSCEPDATVNDRSCVSSQIVVVHSHDGETHEHRTSKDC